MKHAAFDFSKMMGRIFDQVLGIRKIPPNAQLIFLAAILGAMLFGAGQAAAIGWFVVAIKALIR